MSPEISNWLGRICLLAGLCAPACATLQITSFSPSPSSNITIGTSVTWTVLATDSNSNNPLLTFRFNVFPPGGSSTLVKDFNLGQLSSGVWTPAEPFVWVPTGVEGSYRVQVVAKDFTSGESAVRTAQVQVSALTGGSSPVVVQSANPLVWFFAAPACRAGSTMQVWFQEQSKATPATNTNWMNCHGSHSMTFEIGGLRPGTTYTIYSQTSTGVASIFGPTLTFTTPPLTGNITFPTFQNNVPAGGQTDTANSMLLWTPAQGIQPLLPQVATDLLGNILWYYSSGGPYAPPANASVLTRPLLGGGMLAIQSGPAWNPGSQQQQILQQVDLAGNIVRQTNTGIIQRQLLAMGAADGGPCPTTPPSSAPPVGFACLGAFHHDAIQTLPNGWTAALVDIEKIFPAGTQGDTSGLLVDIVGIMIVVLDNNWQVRWYWDAFDPPGGYGYPLLPVSRAATLGEVVCGSNVGCYVPTFLLGAGVAPQAHDWLHANSLYYCPKDASIIWSARHQDWVMKVDYNGGLGTGKILWRMGPGGDFAFNNVFSDPWPWFSHQHDVEIQDGGAGVVTIFDNGNTRQSKLGGLNCTSDCNSRGMALTLDEIGRQVTPLESVDLAVFSAALGSAQRLYNANYFFVAGIEQGTGQRNGHSIETLPTPASGLGTQVLNIETPNAPIYRGWRMPSLYSPPNTCTRDLHGRSTYQIPATVNLVWSAQPNAVLYDVQRSSTKGGPYTQIGIAAGVAYQDTNGLVKGSTYYYVVEPFDFSGGPICQSNEATVSIPAHY